MLIPSRYGWKHRVTGLIEFLIYDFKLLWKQRGLGWCMRRIKAIFPYLQPLIKPFYQMLVYIWFFFHNTINEKSCRYVISCNESKYRSSFTRKYLSETINILEELALLFSLLSGRSSQNESLYFVWMIYWWKYMIMPCNCQTIVSQ